MSKRAWRLRARFEWKVQDCWIGVFWRWGMEGYYDDLSKHHIWICLVPMLPLHIWRESQS